MFKILPFLILFLIITATPVLAAKIRDREQNKGVGSLENCVQESYKNHGEYVSCVARQKLGGEVVSEAARSNIGKRNITPTPSSTPSAAPTVQPTVTPSVTPTISITLTPTPTGTGSAALSVTKNQAVRGELRALIEVLNQILTSLKNLL